MEYEKIMNATQTAKFVDLSKATFYRRLKNKMLPAELEHNGVKIGWTKSYILNWQQNLIDAQQTKQN